MTSRLWKTLAFALIILCSTSPRAADAQVAHADSLVLAALFNATDGPNWNRSDNWLTGNVDDWFGVSTAAGRVTGVNLQNNRLTGTLFLGLGVLTGMTRLDLSQNALSGSIPPDFGNLSSLTQLHLDGNGLTGAIPPELGQLTSLQVLELEENGGLTGSLPAALGLLASLTKIDVGGNQLTGGIPLEYWSMPSLTDLSLDNNQLSGSLPAELGLATALTHLELTNNAFSGDIPVQLGALVNLQQLFLGNNQLSGTLPPEVSTFSNLFFIEVQNNQLTSMPDLSGTPLLFGLKLQANRLEFDDIVPNAVAGTQYAGSFSYAPQDSVGEKTAVTATQSTPLAITLTVGGTGNVFAWYKGGVLLPGETGPTLTIPSVDVSDAGVYEANVTNPGAPLLALSTRPTTVSVNSAPSFTSTAVTAAAGNAPYSYSITTTDPDAGDTRAITGTVPSWLTLTDNGNGTATLAGTPTNAEIGDHAVSLLVTDAAGANATQSFTVTVANTNDAPSFTSTAVTGADQGTAYTYDVTTTDPDAGDTRAITGTVPSWLILSDNGDGTATLAGTPTNDHVGPHDVELIVTDAAGATATQSFTITVTVDDPQRLALTALYERFCGDQWTTKTGWNTASPLSDWFGVTVDDSSHVTKLSLPDNFKYFGNCPEADIADPYGVFPPDFFGGLPFLTDLNLADNWISGPVPEALFYMPNLARLDLARNAFFDVAYNFWGYHCGEECMIPDSVKGFGAFDLEGYGGYSEWGPTGGSLGPYTAPLTYLDLSYSFITGGFAPPGFAPSGEHPDYGGLGYFDVSGNYLFGDLERFLQDGAVVNRVWEEPDPLDCKEIFGEGAAPCKRAEGFPRWTMNLSDSGVKPKIPYGYAEDDNGNLVDLRPVRVAVNLSIGGGHTSYELSGSMWLGSCEFGFGPCYAKAATKSGSVGELAYAVFDVSHNNSEGEIPASIGNIPFLRVLNLGDNRFSGTLPDELGNLVFLDSLVLSNNNFSGELPQSLTALTNLTFFDFGASGAVPPSDPAFQDWLTGVATVIATFAETPEAPSDEFGLSAVYPNPFQGSASFMLRIQSAQHVRVAVYNVLGQRVQVLLDGVLTPGEPHPFRIDAHGLPAGLYVIAVQGETFQASGTAVVAR
ncbi:T9SS type A sorting domain-containing protein [bacterium]|nr:T9SS type A sorting domain-containing protein [bacterium]